MPRQAGSRRSFQTLSVETFFRCLCVSMVYDDSKIDEVVLALLGATEFENGKVWKRIDFAVMDRLHEQGYITSPHGKQESVHLTEKGLALAKALAARYFAK